MKSLSMAALLVAGASTFTACSSDDSIIEQPQQPATPKTCTLTVNATKGGDAAMTRALELSGSTLNATWTKGDKVTVSYLSEMDMGGGVTVEVPTIIGTLTAQSSGTTTMLTGEITTTGIEVGGMYSLNPTTHDLTAGDKLALSFVGSKGPFETPAQQNAQDGTLQTLADYYDNANAKVTVSSVSGSAVTTTTADFANQSTIIRFTLQDKAGNAISPSALTITYKTTGDFPLTNSYDIAIPTSTYTTNNEGVLFVATPSSVSPTGFSGDITLTATVGSDTYVYEKSGVTFTSGNYYEITVKMIKTNTIQEAFMKGKTIELSFTAKAMITSGDLTLSSTFNGSAFGSTTIDGTFANMINEASMAKNGQFLEIAIKTNYGNGTMTINTINNTYTWSNAFVGAMITLTGITIDGNSISPLPTVENS